MQVHNRYKLQLHNRLQLYLSSHSTALRTRTALLYLNSLRHCCRYPRRTGREMGSNKSVHTGTGSCFGEGRGGLSRLLEPEDLCSVRTSIPLFNRLCAGFDTHYLSGGLTEQNLRCGRKYGLTDRQKASPQRVGVRTRTSTLRSLEETTRNQLRTSHSFDCEDLTVTRSGAMRVLFFCFLYLWMALWQGHARIEKAAPSRAWVISVVAID